MDDDVYGDTGVWFTLTLESLLKVSIVTYVYKQQHDESEGGDSIVQPLFPQEFHPSRGVSSSEIGLRKGWFSNDDG